MIDALALCSQIISVLAVFVNAYLLFVYFSCPLRAIRSYKYFFPLAAIHDHILSASIILAVPRVLVGDHSLVFIATGPIRDKVGGIVLLGLYCMAYVSSLMLIVNSFVYKYLQVCRAPLLASRLTKRSVILFLAANLLLIGMWMVVLYVAFWPTDEFIQSQNHMVVRNIGLDSAECAQLGFSLKYSVSTINLSLMLCVMACFVVMANVIVYTAFKINSTIQEGTMSGNRQRLHRQIFTMLLLQAGCPIVFLYTPTFVNYFYIFNGWHIPSGVSFAVTIFVALFPLSNPIIIIAFLNEYRNYTLSKLRIHRRILKRETVFVTSMVKAVTV